MNKFLAILGLFVMSGVAAAQDGISVGVGKLLNNENHDHPGWLIDASYRRGPFQATFTKVSDSYMGSEINSLLLYRKDYSRVSLAGGIVLAQTYEVPAWWFESHDQQGWGLRSQCFLCGVAAQVGFKISNRLELQVRYFGTDHFLIPSHNGAFALLSYRLD